MQRNWIGKSHGAEIVFDIDGSDDQMIVSQQLDQIQFMEQLSWH